MTQIDSLEEKYNFSDFTTENYGRLVDIAKERFTFISYPSVKENHDKNFILWRHDIDVSVHRAVKFAEIEAKKDVQTTYFIHLHNAMYNAFELEIVECIKRIKSLGHHLGLHFDQEFYSPLDTEKFMRCLRFEAKLLEFLYEAAIDVFSFHNTTSFAVGAAATEYAGIINATSTYFREEVAYCSDSNGYWRFRRLEDVLRDPKVKRLQVLTHPEWWQDDVLAPRQRIMRCIEGRARKQSQRYDVSLKEFGRENVDV